ncbi:PBECR2 nuclease fold domain-containing protein [Roseospirillum parvum]|uniref:Phage putative head morphogenesis protein, SPP1 gp7 family n=1 Tax=Roseospirillum parvum TaxID=83401 RepID=A0A1G8GBL4_9PROT|nr:PBECR2 nuclease fold domain-containing protein [Roseospirillum parvum]SDH91754.1 phage putative head morphogenesis protein, SPP1 gp7 family [Roseospirillum parvum]
MAEPDPLTPLPFKEAQDYLRQKVNLPTATWTDLKEGMHARAFVIAGAMKEDLLTDFRGALQKALDEGTTLADFRRDFDRIVARHGWTYKGSRGWRSRVIYDTNMRTARAAGKWQQINTATARERKRGRVLYLRYQAVLDSRTRPQHKAWHGVVLPADHAFWATHYPPNGWYCRCTIQVLTERQLARYGYTPTPADQAPKVMIEARTVRRADGTTTTWPTPQGIDTGWGYNPGEAAWGRNVDQRVFDDFRARRQGDWERIGGTDWEELGLPRDLPVRSRPPLGPPASDQKDVVDAVARTIGGRERTYFTPDGGAVHVSAETLGGHLQLGRAPLAPLLPDLLTDPEEIWMAWERHRLTGRIELRRRFIRAVDLPERGRLMLTVNAYRGRIEAWTFFGAGALNQANRARGGALLYRRTEGD